MSIVIVGGNECMVRQYKELCREYKCKAKIYPKKTGSSINALRVILEGYMAESGEDRHV